MSHNEKNYSISLFPKKNDNISGSALFEKSIYGKEIFTKFTIYKKGVFSLLFFILGILIQTLSHYKAPFNLNLNDFWMILGEFSVAFLLFIFIGFAIRIDDIYYQKFPSRLFSDTIDIILVFSFGFYFLTVFVGNGNLSFLIPISMFLIFLLLVSYLFAQINYTLKFTIHKKNGSLIFKTREKVPFPSAFVDLEQIVSFTNPDALSLVLQVVKKQRTLVLFSRYYRSCLTLENLESEFENVIGYSISLVIKNSNTNKESSKINSSDSGIRKVDDNKRFNIFSCSTLKEIRDFFADLDHLQIPYIIIKPIETPIPIMSSFLVPISSTEWFKLRLFN